MATSEEGIVILSDQESDADSMSDCGSVDSGPISSGFGSSDSSDLEEDAALQ